MNNELKVKVNEEYARVQNNYNDYCVYSKKNYDNLDDALKPFEELKLQKVQEIMNRLDKVHAQNLKTDYCLIEEEEELIKSFYSYINSSKKVSRK